MEWKKYWKWWFQKFFSFFVSVHMLIIVGLFYFLYKKWLGDVAFGICLPVVVTDRILKDIKGMNNKKENNQ